MVSTLGFEPRAPRFQSEYSNQTELNGELLASHQTVRFPYGLPPA